MTVVGPITEFNKRVIPNDGRNDTLNPFSRIGFVTSRRWLSGLAMSADRCARLPSPQRLQCNRYEFSQAGITKGDYIQFYTNGNSKPYDLASSDRSPRQGGGLGVGPICKRGFAASITTDNDENPFANSIRCKYI